MPLRINQLSKRYGNNWALRDIDLDVDDGRIFGIFGGTASGKTSLLRCIAGNESLNGGTVTTGGASVYLAPEKKDGGIASIFGKRSSGSSSGQAKVSEFERTLDSDSQILLLDDPFVGIDEDLRGKLIERLRQKAASGKTIIFASTDFQQVAELCEKMLVLVGGNCGQTGFTQDIYENPETSGVAAIVGRNNLFKARRLSSTNAEAPEFYSIEGEHRIFAQPTEKRRIGAINQTVTLAILPEHISITFGASFPEDNLLKAVVTGIRFLGDTTLIDLDANGLRLSARVFRVVGLNIGEECMIGMPPHRILVLKD
ncbi:MAG: ATP-binding cassette domain-containing protein [Chloracidobacterium sp.]|nr:ATP-binding cassette domain-containing protein [Chloracidobacterium sp.]